MKQSEIGTGFHLLAKPFGPICNMACDYCFYLEKKQLYPDQKKFLMADDVLEIFIQRYIEDQPAPEVQFVWQGGEPTLMGVSYYKKIIAFQRKYSNGKKIINSIQTNGLKLDDLWCEFLKANDFIVGVSLDGPAKFHDRYRVNHNFEATHNEVEMTIKRLQKFKIKYNVLVCVTNESSAYGVEIYQYLKDLGVRFIQFTPIVERKPQHGENLIPLIHASPSSILEAGQLEKVTPFSVRQGAYGKFLTDVFEQWVRNDVGDVFVMNFEWALESWLGLPSTVCVFSENCGRALAIEHNGDLYSCDHYVYPEYKLGNILDDSPNELLNKAKQVEFGTLKSSLLPSDCQTCEVKFACHGECPRHRFSVDSHGEKGLSYLCADYKAYFNHIHRYMKVMVQLIHNGLPVSDIRKVIQAPLIVKKSAM